MGIYLNQVGYPTNSVKIAVTTAPCNFQIIREKDQISIYDGTTTEGGFDAASGDATYHIDFSKVTVPGRYYILTGDHKKSPLFTIGDDVYHQLKLDLMKVFYYQRCGCALTEKYAGEYTHAECHTAPAIFLEDYLNQTQNPQAFDMTGGWHDAGDFGRYSTAGSVALAHLLYAYELFPESFQDSLNIPESDNAMPDILNECMYELKWLLKMQAEDGGVYHKLTSFCHADFVMPEDDHMQFLIFPVSSMAVADFAAVMALASRVYKPFDEEFSTTALHAARKAWKWLLANPYVGFHNPEGSNTGEYDDECDLDERMWASAELVRTDFGFDDTYLEKLTEYVLSDINKTDFGWTDVSGLTLLATLFDPKHHAGAQLEQALKTALFADADKLLSLISAGGYRLGMAPEDYVWGSNMVVLNRSMLLILASLLTSDDKKSIYKDAALEHLHYLLGKNALGISYVTRHGENAYCNPHNRPTFADGIELPMAGWVSGGPFKSPCDPKAVEMIPQGTPPMKCYIDHVDSYSTNEITIYWNSPAVFITAFFDLQK